MLAGLFEFFAVGAFGFYLLLFLLFVLITAFEENDKDISALITLIAGFAFCQWVCHLQVFHWIGHHILGTIGYVLLYFAFGGLWGLFKWVLFLRTRLEDYKRVKEGFSAWKEASPAWKGKEYTALKDFLQERGATGMMKPPQVRDYKGKVTHWMTYWPFSLIWFLIHDPITRFFKTLFNFMSGTFQSISNRMFASVEKDLEK
jgi:hypothetical protein